MHRSDVVIKHILVATDFSPPAEEAVRRALELAEALHAEVTLLHAWFAPIYAMPSGRELVPDPTIIAEMASSARVQLEALRERLTRPGLKLSTRVVEGPPAETIVRVADSEKFDLLVVGTHGRTGMRHLLLGSVAERVVRIAHTPVMTVHAAP